MWFDGGPRAAAPTPASRHPTPDARREHEDQPFGCKIAKHHEGLTHEGNDLATGWNQRRGTTFPPDAPKPGDPPPTGHATGTHRPARPAPTKAGRNRPRLSVSEVYWLAVLGDGRRLRGGNPQAGSQA